MAHRILGIDLGAYSVKVIVVQPGFRQAAAVDFIERAVPPGEEPYEIRASRVLGAIVREHKLSHDVPYAAASGDKLFIHVLEFPFRGLRRPELEKAVGAELEGILPIDLEDMVFGFESVPPPGVAPADAGASNPALIPPGNAIGGIGDDDPTQVQGRPAPPGVVHGRVAAPAEGMRVLACAMETSRARDLIDLIGDNAVEPRGLVAAPASYMRVVERIVHLAGDKGRSAGAAPVAVIDIGHDRTDVCVVLGGHGAYARTIKRGGRHLTEAISREWRISYEEAETAKHTDGFIGSTAEPPQTEEWQRVHQIVATEVGPLGKEIKRTLNSCRAKTGISISEVVLVGGGSRLRGLPSYMAEVLHVPVTTLDVGDTRSILGDKLAQQGVSADVACLAAGVAYEGAGGRPHFDLRQGELSYKADLSFLRQKAGALAAILLVVVAFASVNAFASLYNLRTAETNLDTRLDLETRELFGEPLSADEALGRVGGGTTTGGSIGSPLPRMTAYDILLEISKSLPTRKDVTLNVENLDIKRGKITLKLSAASAADLDKIEESLKKIECFKEVSRGSTSSGSTAAGSSDVRRTTFGIKSECM